MKGLNVKKLAAIATGAALLGTAVAPIVSAISVQKSDIYSSDGKPVVNIVVGSKEFKVALSSASGGVEVPSNNDTNAITDAQLPHLFNKSVSQRVNNGDQ